MAKRVKIESLFLVISSFGTVCGAGIDSASAWRDAVERSSMFTSWKDMAFAGYAAVESVANVTYDPIQLGESRAAYSVMKAKYYAKDGE
jgi:hypothetical protein